MSSHPWIGRVHLGEGDIDWPATRKALHDIGYDGSMTTEIRGGDRAYLADVVARIDRFLAGEPPVAAAAPSGGVGQGVCPSYAGSGRDVAPRVAYRGTTCPLNSPRRTTKTPAC